MANQPRIIGETASSPEPVGEAPGNRGDPREPDAVEIGGRGGPDPTRYGDWEKNGRCIDF